MGGQGSGRARTRVEVEAVVRLHLPEMMRAGRVRPGARILRDLEWGPDGAPPVAAVRLVADLGDKVGHLELRHRGGEAYTVDVVSVPQPFGGRRWWLICPDSGVRTSTLYMPTGAARFASRQAHQLGYRTQRLGARGRAEEREVKVRMALGGAGEPGGPLPDKPKGMRWATYRRLQERAGGG